MSTAAAAAVIPHINNEYANAASAPKEKKELTRYTVIPSDSLIRMENGCPAISPELKTYLGMLAAVVLLAAFVVLAIYINTYLITVASASPYIPLGGLMTALLLDPLSSVASRLWNWGRDQANIENGVRKEFSILQTKNTEEELRKIGIRPADIQNRDQFQNLDTLAPVLAHRNFWLSQFGLHKTKLDGLKAKFLEDPTEEHLAKLEKEQNELLNAIARAHVRVVYFQALLHNPCFTKSLEEIGTFVNTPMRLRTFASSIGIANQFQEIFRFTEKPGRDPILLTHLDNREDEVIEQILRS